MPRKNPSGPHAANASPQQHTIWRGTPFAVAAIALATLAAYANSFQGPLVFDDIDSILTNPSIRHFWRIADVLSPPHADGMTVGGRPLLNLTLALNYAISGIDVWSYHALNIFIHLVAGLTLFGIVRRTLAMCPGLATRGAHGNGMTAMESDLIALAVAALWTLHPLQTESVTYIIQRAESLMGFFYLQTLYAFIRSVEAPGSRGWRAWCVGACLMGMATKEVMVSAPLIVLLYDRTFVSGTLRNAWRARSRLYVALACTWIPLGLLVASTGGNRGGSMGFGIQVGWWEHALTQFEAVSRYLWLSFWPHPLVFDYGPEKVGNVSGVILCALFIGVLAWITLRGFWRRTALGFAGIWFFAILAPTSLLPEPTQMTVEHRMYLPLAVVMTGAVIAAYRIIGRRALFAALLVSIGFAGLTFARNSDYRSEISIWDDTVHKRPENPVALTGYGRALFNAGRLQDAVTYIEMALRIHPTYAVAWNNLGVALGQLNRLPEATEAYATSLRYRPDRAYVRENFARALVSLGRLEEAAGQYEEALKSLPESADDHSRLGSVLMQLNRMPEAADHFAVALRFRPEDPDLHFNLGNALVSSSRVEEAVPHFEKAVVLKPSDMEAACNLAEALLEVNRPGQAVARFEAALAIQPSSAMVHSRYGIALARLGQGQQSIDQVVRAVQLQPGDASLRLLLADITAQAGRSTAAVGLYEAFLRSNPDRALQVEAHFNLGMVYFQLGDRTKSSAEFQSALAIDPNFAPARSALTRLQAGP